MSKESLQLPKTAFSMKANLPNKEPGIIKHWEQTSLYKKLRQQAKGKKNLYFMMVPLTLMATFIWEQLLIKF